MVPKPVDEYKERWLFKREIENRLQKLFFYWIQEAIADLIAIHIGGPGAFFSFAYQAILEPSLDDYTKDERYPSFRIRLLKMLEELKKIGFEEGKFKEWSTDVHKKKISELLRNKLHEWEKLLNIGGEKSYNDDIKQSEIEIVEKCFFHTFPIIREQVIARLKEFENVNKADTIDFNADVFGREVFHLVELIEKEISPNEIIVKGNIENKGKSDPARWASILNAGWLCDFCVLDRDRTTIYSENDFLNRVKDKNNMFLLFTKAIERSEIHKQFLNMKSRFSDL